jgi:hypothetical protein
MRDKQNLTQGIIARQELLLPQLLDSSTHSRYISTPPDQALN